jgi:hypothetical protein
MGVVFCVLGYKAVLDYTASALLASLVVLLGAFVFVGKFRSVVASVRVKNGSIEITRSLDHVSLAQDAILTSRVFVLSPSRWIGVVISVNGRRLPVLLECVVLDHSSVGGFRATVAAFRDLFGRPGRMIK